MPLAHQILRAAHASGTHHKLALDALLDLDGPSADAWRRLFLSEIKLFLDGSKAPDKEFKDFKNHVLHPGDDYWGGAPEKVRNWYQHLVTAMKDGNWSEAAWCAGILSHYFTDPVMPFHTAQSEAENAIHRAAEWSISKSCDALLREARLRAAPSAPPPDADETWIADYVCRAAETSHAQYERLIAHYDIHLGAVEPEKGLDPVARRLIGDLLVYARTGYAQLLQRAIAEAGVEPPSRSLAARAILATLQIPARWVLNRIEDAATRRQVEAMYDELMRTGRVEETLPEDDRAIRDLHASEVLAPRAAVRAAERAKRIKSGREKSARQQLLGITDRAKTPLSPAELAEIPTLPALPVKLPTDAASRSAGRRFLNPADPVVDGPSVGPRTAERLAGLGILTVADLLEAEAARVAAGLADSRIPASTVERWQDEARLMLAIPGLKASQAQLLVGAGYRFAEDIAEAQPHDLSAALLAFAATHAGQRLLREGEPPDIEHIKRWIDAAHAAAEAA